jgi:hypothetical protein
MKKLLLSIIAVFALQFSQAQTTNPCGLYLNGYNQTANYSISYCGGDSISLLIQGGGGINSTVVMSIQSGSSLITSNASIQPTAQQPTYNISFLAPFLNTTFTYTFTLTLEDTSCVDPNAQLFTANYSITILASTQMNLFFPNGICENVNPFILNQGFPLGGVYSGAGITYITPDYIFDPGSAGVGTHLITYITSQGTVCDSVATDSIEVLVAPTVTVNDTSYCKFDPFPIVTPITTGLVNNFLWINLGNNNQYTTPTLACVAGTYSLQVTASNGCSESTTFTVTENPLPTAQIFASSFCIPTILSQLTNNPNYTYLWNTGPTTNSIYADTAILYHLTVTDITTGCMAEDSVEICPPGIGCLQVSDINCPGDTASLCFHPCDSVAGLNYQYTWSTFETTQCISVTIPGTYNLTVTDLTGQPHYFNYTVNAPTLNAQILGGDSLYCINDVISLSSASVPIGTSFQWTTSTGYIPTNPNDSVIDFLAYYLGVGIHQVYLEVRKGICIDYDTISFEIMPSISGIDGDTNVCFGDSIHLFADPQDPSYSYFWSWIDNGITYTSTDSSITFLPTTATNYLLIVSNSICTSSYVANIPFYNNFNVPFIGDTLMCSGDSLQIAVNLPNALYDFLWMNGDTSAGITVYTGGTYTVDVTLNSIGCTVTNSMSITTIPSPSPQTIYGDTNMCSNGLDSLWTDSVSGLHYTWTGNVHDTMLHVQSSGTYSLLITDTTTNCSSYQEITISEFPLEQYYIDYEPDTVICEGDSVYLTVLDSLNNSVPPINNSVLWNTGATTNSITTGTNGIHWAAVTDLNGCTDTAFINITVNTLPNVNIIAVGGTACEDSVLLVLDSLSASVLNPSGISWGNDSLWVYQSGTYYVTVTDTNGCRANDAIKIIFDSACCRVPNADIRLPNGGTSGDLMQQNQNLGAPNPNEFNNLTILIKDTLFVNHHIIFNNCKIYMGPYAVIWYNTYEVSPYIELDSTHIQSCSDTMWQGIYVNIKGIEIRNASIIEDGIEAVIISFTSYPANFRIRNSTFNNNWYNLVTYPLTVSNSTFIGSTINNDSSLLIPHSGEGSFTGILMHEPPTITIGDGSNLTYKNRIYNLKYGIVSIDGNFNVYNTHFENITVSNTTFTNPLFNLVSTASIYTINNTNKHFVTNIGDTTQFSANYFNHFTNGIYAKKMHSLIIRNTFNEGAGTGIRTSLTSGRFTYVYKNHLESVMLGVWADLNDDSFYIIDDNKFITNPNGSQSFVGIYAGNISAFANNYFLTSNNCIEDVLLGSLLNQIKSPIFENNYVLNSWYGLWVNYCDYSRFTLNNVLGDFYTTERGITVSHSKYPYLKCNSSLYFKEAMHFDGNSRGYLKNNTVGVSGSGIVVDNNGSIGQQGTKTDPWDNKWVGGGWSFARPHLLTLNGSVGSNSIFWTRNAYPYNPTTTSSNYLFGATPIPIPNYVSTSPPIYTCPNLPNCNPNTNPPSFTDTLSPDIALMESVATADTALVTDPRVYNNQQRLYEELKDSSALTNNNLILTTFVNDKKNEDIGRILRMEEKVRDSLYTDAKNILDSMMAIEPIEVHNKIVYDKMLASYLRGEDITQLTTAELDSITTIAYLCPHTDGLVVYTARTICHYYDEYWIDYMHPCEKISNEPSERFAETEKKGIHLLKLHPNPAQDIVTVQTNIDAGGKLFISNNLGQIVAEYTLTESNTFEIDISHLINGIYFCKLMDKSNTVITTKKLDIIR